MTVSTKSPRWEWVRSTTPGPVATASILVALACCGAATGCSEGPRATRHSGDLDAGGVGDAGADGDADVQILPDNAIVPRFRPGTDGFFDMPWPSDYRLDDDGTVNGDEIPTNGGLLMRKLRHVVGKLDGYSTAPVVYIGLNRAPGQASLPRPADTLDAAAPVQLLDVSQQGCGRRIPIEVRFEADQSVYHAPRLLEAAPVPGYILDPNKSYALVVRRSFGRPAGLQTVTPPAFEGMLSDRAGAGRLGQSYEPLRDCLPAAGLTTRDIAVATVLTTDDPVAPTRALRSVVRDPATRTPHMTLWHKWERKSKPGVYHAYRGKLEMPIFQTGQTPYSTKGGLVFDADGRPIIQRWEKVPFSVTFPAHPAGPLDLLVWEGGTGAILPSHVGDRHIVGALREGFAVASFVPQFHGQRAINGADPLISTFNYFNPTAVRTNFRQQIAETSYFVRFLEDVLPGRVHVPALNTDRAFFGGHSQGAIVGAMVAGVEPDFDAFMLSGVGGYLSNALVWRTDPIDVPEFLAGSVGAERPLDRFHLVIQSSQLGADVVDPLNYARYWKGWPGAEGGSDVFIINGKQDVTTSHVAMNALVRVANVATAEPVGWDVDPWGLADIDVVQAPIEANRTAMDGSKLTFGARFSPDHGHFTLYESARVSRAAVRFWKTARDGSAVIRFSPPQAK